MNSAKDIQQWLEHLDAGDVLELAAGSGKFTNWIVSRLKDFHSWTYTDPDESILDKAREKFTDQRFSFVKTRAELLPFPNATFNTVIISRGLHHLSKLSGAIWEMIRVLKPSGNLIIHEMHADVLNEAQRNRHLWHHFRIELDQELGREHEPVFSKDELIRIFGNFPLSITAQFEYIPPDTFDPEERKKEYERDIMLLDAPALQKIFSEKLHQLFIRTKEHGIENQPYLFLVFRKTN